MSKIPNGRFSFEWEELNIAGKIIYIPFILIVYSLATIYLCKWFLLFVGIIFILIK